MKAKLSPRTYGAPSRNTALQLALCGLTIALGLGSRLPWAPALIVAYVGDTLYAVLIFLLLGLVRPRARTPPLAAAALVVCFGIEASQAWHPAWLDALRSHRLAALVLGRGFLWSDLACYAVGVSMAAAGERLAGRGG